MCSWVKSSLRNKMKIAFVFSPEMIENTQAAFCKGMYCACVARFLRTGSRDAEFMYPLVEDDVKGRKNLPTKYRLYSPILIQTALYWYDCLRIIRIIHKLMGSFSMNQSLRGSHNLCFPRYDWEYLKRELEFPPHYYEGGETIRIMRADMSMDAV